MTGDGVRPLCVFCGDPIDLEAHMARLDAHGPLIGWMLENMPAATVRIGAKCDPCREDPERAYRAISEASDEELQARMRGRA
jgi:hypothetical protein